MNRAPLLVASFAIAAAAAQASPLAKSTWIECTPRRCGDFAVNIATMTMAAGHVSVASNGAVRVSISDLRDKATGQSQAFKRLEVFYGTLFDQVIATESLGFITTDALGDYTGKVPTVNGRPYKFRRGSFNQGNFYINDPAIPNNQFVSGFAIP